jgi:hypothetical protein
MALNVWSAGVSEVLEKHEAVLNKHQPLDEPRYMVDFWVLAPYSLSAVCYPLPKSSHFSLEDGGNIFLRNAGI